MNTQCDTIPRVDLEKKEKINQKTAAKSNQFSRAASPNIQLPTASGSQTSVGYQLFYGTRKMPLPPKLETAEAMAISKDTASITFKEMGLSEAEIRKLFARSTMGCSIDGLDRQVDLAVCQWHKDDGDPRCVVAKCRHTSDFSRSRHGASVAGEQPRRQTEEETGKLIEIQEKQNKRQAKDVSDPNQAPLFQKTG